MHKQTRQYRQLTPEQRYQLQVLYNKGFPQHQIAESLGVHTVTLDNGGEFARHEKVSQSTKTQIYFARPYASYQRGTNENTNGLVRRQWPKRTAFGSLTEQDVSELELRLNMTLRKVLNRLTAIEVYTSWQINN
ncbi:IS30 family transposase [Xenorhabdus bovienii]|uniref:IS30 family transposase n=1 Tax=Xenorhabdus bovienii TaxID=40576 RepID=UPI0023B24AA2|nr:IS30 family transposase [Xenorhabdus bovienii]MDE9446852.1 IS30 family transposase [Xenorhabdus bovienii]